MLVERALEPLDVARGLVLRALSRTLSDLPPVRRMMSARAARVPALLALHAALAFGLAVWVPVLPLVVGPLVFGVPHVASDVRVLVLRRALPRWWLAAIAIAVVALLALRALDETGAVGRIPMRVEHLVGCAWILVGAIAGTRARRAARAVPVAVAGVAGAVDVDGGRHRATSLVSVVVFALALAVAAVALAAPRGFRVALLHGHNLLAIAIWLALARRELRRCILPAALALAGAAWLASGAWLAFTVRHGVLSLFGLHLFAAADVIAPGFADATGIALTMSFAFLQSVHYAMWLVGIPRADARTRGSPTFRMSWRNLARDLTGPGIVALIGFAALVGGAGVLAPLRTRGVFLSLATFHAWLELALLAFFATRRAWGQPRLGPRVGARATA